VTIDGRPFATGKVMFSPMAKSGEVNVGKPGFGRLDADGRFVLSTYADDDGAVVGEHSVTIINTADSSAAGVPRFERVTVSGKFSVLAGQRNEIEVRVSAQQISQFGSR
jgi:hypothetical protein